ncbi:hypothetical protein GCM10022377_00280 [Zhihengliuella alba]|uniref:HTH cro/C1-type domain-containing protein n=1 Tax=Zhihengliuella alba TaxID=547018 RepID=A0ABP7CJV3_9MICC
MHDDERERLFVELFERPDDRERILEEAQLSDHERVEIAELAGVADALWLSAQEAPALEDDPVAAMLGLVPDAECSLDPSSLSRARKRSRLAVSDLAARLQQRGWEVSAADVFRWETRSAADVSPAEVQAIAEILRTPVESLISKTVKQPLPDLVQSVRSNPRFAQLVTRWANAQKVSLAFASAALESRMLATVHRGERPSPEQLLESLGVLVDAIEGTDQRRGNP